MLLQYCYRCVHSQDMYLQPLNSNIVSWVQLLQITVHLGLWAAADRADWWSVVVCYMDSCQRLHDPTLCSIMRNNDS